MKKNDFLDMLKQNDNFKAVLGAAKDDKERRFIKAYTEDFMLKCYDGLIKGALETFKKDPEELKKELLKAQEELIKSGSKQ